MITPSPQNASFTFKMKGDFASLLAANGLTGPTASVSIPVSIFYNGLTFQAVVPKTYISNGKSGHTK